VRAGCGLQIGDGVLDVGGDGPEVHGQQRSLAQMPEDMHVDLGVQRQHVRIDLFDGVFAGVPPPGHFAADEGAEGERHVVGVGFAGGDLAEAHEEGGKADAVEAHVTGTAHAVGVGFLAGVAPDNLLAEMGQLQVGGECAVESCPASAGGINVDMGHAVVVQLLPVVVHIPGGAGIAPVTVAAPEGDAQAAAQLLAVGAEDAGDLGHGGVGAAIVHGPHLPRIEVAAEEHEVVALCAGQIGDQDGRLGPVAVDVGVEPHTHREPTGRGGDAAAQVVAILFDDGNGGSAGNARGGLGGGRAPHAGDDHVVEMVVVDEDLAGGSGALRFVDGGGSG